MVLSFVVMFKSDPKSAFRNGFLGRAARTGLGTSAKDKAGCGRVSLVACFCISAECTLLALGKLLMRNLIMERTKSNDSHFDPIFGQDLGVMILCRFVLVVIPENCLSCPFRFSYSKI